MIVHTDAIVLHSRKYSDTSRIVVLYTKDFGKMSVVAKGARMPKSQFGSALEPLGVCRVTVYHKPMRDLHTVTSAETTKPWTALRDSYDHLQAGLTVCEALLRTQTDEEPNAAVYAVLSNGLDAIDCSTAPFLTAVAVRLQLADAMGFGLPDSGPPLPSVACVLRMTDGVMLGEQFVGRDASVRLSTDAYSVLHSCMRNTFHTVISVGDSTRSELEAFLSSYFSYHLDRRVTQHAFNVMR